MLSSHFSFVFSFAERYHDRRNGGLGGAWRWAHIHLRDDASRHEVSLGSGLSVITGSQSPFPTPFLSFFSLLFSSLRIVLKII